MEGVIIGAHSIILSTVLKALSYTANTSWSSTLATFTAAIEQKATSPSDFTDSKSFIVGKGLVGKAISKHKFD